jgi:hypothetical protein
MDLAGENQLPGCHKAGDKRPVIKYILEEITDPEANIQTCIRWPTAPAVASEYPMINTAAGRQILKLIK